MTKQNNFGPRKLGTSGLLHSTDNLQRVALHFQVSSLVSCNYKMKHIFKLY